MKKWLSLTTSALSIYMATYGSAEAGPLIGLAAGVFGAIASGAGLTQIILGVALKVGMSLLQMAMTPNAPEQKPVGVKLQVEVGDDRPVSSTIGLYATSGKRKYIGSYGDQDGTPNSHLTEVIELGNIPVSALNGIWIDGEKCKILWDEPVSRGYPIKEYRDDGDDHVWVRFHDGSQTQADQYMRAKFGDNEKRPWTEKMVGRGIPYVIMTYRWNRELLRGQPNCIFEVASIPLYDIRKDSSNGGFGAQRWEDPATWEPSLNLAVMAYNVARGLHYKGEWFFGGQNVAAHRLPSSAWIAAAQECSRLIENADGTSSAQFRGGFEITGDLKPTDVLEEFRKGMNARLVDSAGQLKIKAGAHGASVFAFTDDDIIVTEAQGFDPFPPLDQTINGISATYPEPEEQWAAKDAPTLTNDAHRARDRGHSLMASLQYRAVPYNRQVQRLMRAALKEERRFRTHQIWLPPEAYGLEPGIDTVAWTSDHNGYAAKKFLVIEIEGDPTMNQLVTLQEIDPSDYDWSSEFELPTSTGWLGRIVAPTQQMTGWAVEASSILDNSGLERRPAIKVSCAAFLDDIMKVHVKVRLKETGDIVFDSDQTPYADPYSWLLAGEWLLPDEDYEVAGKYVPFTARTTSWSAWLPLHTKKLLVSSTDVFDNAITQQKIADAAVSAAKIMNDAVTSLKLADQAVSTAKLQVAAVTAQILADQAVISTKLADAAVTGEKLADGAVNATKFASGIRPVEVVAVLPASGNTEGRTVYLTTDDKLYRYTGSAWVASVAAADVTGQMISSQIADAAITAQKLASASIDATKFASTIKPIEVVSALPATGNVEGRTVYLTTDDKLYRYTGAAWVASVASSDITGTLADAQITAVAASKVTGQMTDAQIAGVAAAKVTGALIASQIADAAITNQKLAALAVDAAKLATNAVTTTKIADDAISTDKLQANAVVADKIATNSITARHLVLTDTQNLLPNGSFTQGLDGWGRILGTVVAIDNSDGPIKTAVSITRGTTEASLTAFGGWSAANSPDNAIFAAAGDKFFVEAWVKSTTAYNGTFLDLPGVRVSDGATVVAGSLNGNVAANVWTKISGVISAAVNSYVHPRIHPSAANNTTVEVTGVRVLRMNAASLIVDGSLSANFIAAGAITTEKLATGSVSADQIAASSISAIKLSAGSVEAAKIAAGAVSADKIASGAVTTAKLDALAVTAEKIAVNAITAGKIAAGAVSADQIAAGAIVAGKIAAGAVTATALAVGNFDNIVPDADCRSLTWWFSTEAPNGMSFIDLPDWTSRRGVAASPGTYDLSSAFFPVEPGASYRITARIYTTAEFVGYWQPLVHMPSYAWYSLAHGKGATVGQADAANAIVAPQDVVYQWIVQNPAGIATNANNRWQFRNKASISAGFGVMIVTITRISDTSLIVNGAIVADKLATSAVTAAKIAAGAITADKIDANAVTAGKIAAGAVNTAQLVAGAVTAGILASNAVTAEKISAGVVGAREIAANSIYTAALQATAITADKLAANSVTTAAIAAQAITAEKIQASTITGDRIAANTIGANNIAAGAITARTMVLTDFSNIADHGFQQGDLSGWITANVQAYYNDPNQGDASGWALVSNARVCAYSALTAVSPGEVYFVDVWVNNANAARAACMLMGFNASGTLVWTGYGGAYTDDKNTWRRLQDRIAIPGGLGVVRVALGLLIDQASAGGLNAAWAKPVLRRANSGELIVDGAITAAKIAANSISAGMIQAGAIAAGHLSAGAVTADKIAALSISTDKLSVGGVTVEKIAQNAAAQVWQNVDTSTFNGVSGAAFVSILTLNLRRDSGNDTTMVFADVRAQISNMGTDANGLANKTQTLLVELWDSSNNSLAAATLTVTAINRTSVGFIYFVVPNIGATPVKIVVKPDDPTRAANWVIGRRSITAMQLNKST